MKSAISWASFLAITIIVLPAPAAAEIIPSTKAEWRNFRYGEIRSDCRTDVADVRVEYGDLPTTVDGVNAITDVVLLGFKEPEYREGRAPLSSFRIGHPITIKTTFGTLFNGVVATHKDGYFYIATDQHFLGQWWYDDMMGLTVYLTDDTSTRGDMIVQHSNDIISDRVKISNSLSCAQEHQD